MAEEFKLLYLDDANVRKLCWSAAMARALYEDSVPIRERNCLDLPGGIGQATRIGSKRRRDSGSMKGNRYNYRLWIDGQATDYYKSYVAGFSKRIAVGPKAARKYLDAICLKKAEATQGLKYLHEKHARKNRMLDTFMEASAIAAMGSKFAGTVVLASASTLAAVTGSAAAAPAAIIYLGYKAAATGVDVATSDADAWDSAKGLAIGKYENGNIQLGEVGEKAAEKSLEGLVLTYRKEMARQILTHKETSKALVTAIAEDASRIHQLSRANSFQQSAYEMMGDRYEQMVKRRTALDVERQVIQNAGIKGAAAKAFAKGIPLVFLASDVISASGTLIQDWEKL